MYAVCIANISPVGTVLYINDKDKGLTYNLIIDIYIHIYPGYDL